MKKINVLIVAILMIASFSLTAQVAITTDGSSADGSAMLDVKSTTKGLLPPRMTQAQMNAISSPANGLMVYCTDCTPEAPYFYNGTFWVNIGKAASTTPGAPTITTVLGGNAQAMVHFTQPASDGGSTITSYTATSNPGSITGTLAQTGSGTITVTGLTNGTTYTFTVTATNGIGTGAASAASNSVTPSFWNCGVSHSIAHTSGDVAPETVIITYGTVLTNLTGTDKCWITQNLGASQQATSATDATDASAGWYWRFNRKQGYKVNPIEPVWLAPAINENSGWVAAQDPCTIELGTGWRIPTYSEWEDADANGGWNNYNDTYNSVLKLHAAGYISSGVGSLSGRGSAGWYWTTMEGGPSQAIHLEFGSGFSAIAIISKSIGHSVRCLRD